jgi:Sulfotransferase family
MILEMGDRYPRPDWVRRMNRMGESVGSARELIPLDVDALVESARDTTGLERFGDFDGDWWGRLDSLIDEIEATANLSVIGRLMTRQEILRCLRTRLFMTRELEANPAILEEEIKEPMIVTGPARSGTTILFELLSLDPELRPVLGWESAHPVPETDDRSALLAMTECEQELWTDLQPEFASVHENRSDLPVECITPTMPSFASFMWWITSNVPNWPPDFVAAMQFHKVYLQLMQSRRAGPKPTWVLKTPTHLPVLDLIFATYPDAWVVLTHRDPMKTVPSGLSTLALIRWTRSDSVDTASFGGDAGTATFDLMLHVKNRREAGELPDRFVDLHFLDQVRDPVDTIEKAYTKMGRPFGTEHANRIRRYLAEKPKGKFGSHRYDVADWGYSREEIRSKTSAYVEAFEVELEDERS